MPDVQTRGDAIRAYLTGAARRDDMQSDPSASLGGFAGCVEVAGRAWDREQPIRGLRVLAGSGMIPAGVVGLSAPNTGEVALSAGGDGSNVAIALGETKLIEGADPSQWIRVERTSANPLGGTETVTVSDVHEGGMGFDDVANADRAAGITQYREFRLRNVSEQTASAIKLWVAELGTAVASDSAQLGATGAGSIGSTTKFYDWPRSGWARIEESGGTLREIVYYADRTESALNVTIRALLGTTAAAGAATDVVRAVPGIRFGKAAPFNDETELIADDETAPSGMTWYTVATVADALTHGSLQGGDELGIWVERVIPAGMAAAPVLENALRIRYTWNSENFDSAIRGVYRVEDTTIQGYELYKAEGGAAFDFEAAPWKTFSALPFTTTGLTTGTTTRFVLRYRNKYNLISQNPYDDGAFAVELDGGGNQLIEPPTAPVEVFAEMDPNDNGLRVVAAYFPAADEPDRADEWRIWITTDDSTPDPDAGAATATVAMLETSLLEILETAVALADVPDGAPVKVILRTARTSDSRESANSAMVTATWIGAPPRRTVGQTFTGRKRSTRRTYPTGAPTSPTDDTVIDAGNSIRIENTGGSAALYAGTTLIWRVIFDEDRVNNYLYIPSDWTLNGVDAVPAGGTSEAIDVIAWSVGVDQRLGVNVAGVRVMQIDVLATDIRYAVSDDVTWFARRTGEGGVVMRWDQTLWQVWDRTRGEYTSAMLLESDGTWRRQVYVDQTLNQTEIEAL